MPRVFGLAGDCWARIRTRACARFAGLLQRIFAEGPAIAREHWWQPPAAMVAP
jgi:hypothetical protein